MFIQDRSMFLGLGCFNCEYMGLEYYFEGMGMNILNIISWLQHWAARRKSCLLLHVDISYVSLLNVYLLCDDTINIKNLQPCNHARLSKVEMQILKHSVRWIFPVEESFSWETRTRKMKMTLCGRIRTHQNPHSSDCIQAKRREN